MNRFFPARFDGGGGRDIERDHSRKSFGADPTELVRKSCGSLDIRTIDFGPPNAFGNGNFRLRGFFETAFVRPVDFPRPTVATDFPVPSGQATDGLQTFPARRSRHFLDRLQPIDTATIAPWKLRITKGTHCIEESIRAENSLAGDLDVEYETSKARTPLQLTMVAAARNVSR